MPKHPSKEASKRAAFIVDDLVDDLEAYFNESARYWEDTSPMSVLGNRLRAYIKYVRTGETIK